MSGTYEAGVYSCFFDILSNSSNKSSAIFKVGIKISLINNRTGLSFNAWLLIGKRKLVQYFNIGQSISQCYFIRRHSLAAVFTLKWKSLATILIEYILIRSFSLLMKTWNDLKFQLCFRVRDFHLTGFLNFTCISRLKVVFSNEKLIQS